MPVAGPEHPGRALGASPLPWFRYGGPVSSQRVPGGVVHKLPADLRKALIPSTAALDAWMDITPLARNEFICWVEDAKQEMTRECRGAAPLAAVIGRSAALVGGTVRVTSYPDGYPL